ncbi:RnfABCDGE type electron transport complex subunit B [Comamonas piscis]|uniref:RnfABCDGE type electron transport complex subunit B n=1 Tax=Comamonas piscis TaxID=1562974 RepID=A0A7G5EP44_9BURK|nr:RnfABCDGE type electron transport complex subunit B [Comamonas piscis]QMV75769.1 RnfABCDGE type electron transport complex subunit B [Comamonas piscis]WSO36349.1 RnfABCDGE type electron transport complex subunit B [Comamonas piscis]
MAVFIGAIDAALPQTQCTRCGYPDCRHYAQAIARREAAINQCPPGGQEGVARLAAITGLPALPLNPDNGLEAVRVVARIDENWCIGCTLCIKACPTDAILGANKRMHSIIAEACTGCELCLPVCPVDCIELDNASGDATGWAAWSPAQADDARLRYRKHQQRLERAHGPLDLSPADTAADASAATAATTAQTAQAAAVSAAALQNTAASKVQLAAPAATDKKAILAAILAKAQQQQGGNRSS